MSGKLIMKRKRASQEEQLQQQQQQPHQQEQQDEEPAPEKRHRPLTPPAEDPSEDQACRPDSANRILLEALQKIMELQSELDAFEQDLDERDAAAAGREDPDTDTDTDPEDAEVAAQFVQAAATPAQRSQAEALGFAMCARETLLFLQSEGVPTESPLYQTLLGKLVGQSDGLLNA
ncbi:hypothetical protein KR038_004161 [Drosophila bunnanda]|nr:hypothetical protein KR038_004161 [Drosophila bunnanda]